MTDYNQNTKSSDTTANENRELFKRAINEALELKFNRILEEAENIEVLQAHNPKHE